LIQLSGGHLPLICGPVWKSKVSNMDEREIEQGYANFHRKFNSILRLRDVRVFKAYVSAHPRQAGRLSHCLGLSDELAEIEMYKAMLVRPALKDIQAEAVEWLETRGFQATVQKRGRGRKRGHSRRR